MKENATESKTISQLKMFHKSSGGTENFNRLISRLSTGQSSINSENFKTCLRAKMVQQVKAACLSTGSHESRRKQTLFLTYKHAVCGTVCPHSFSLIHTHTSCNFDNLYVKI